MKEFIRFYFEPIDDDEGNGNDVFALVELPDNLDERNVAVNEISDSISAYMESVPAWDFEKLVRDVLDASGYKYEIITPCTICI